MYGLYHRGFPVDDYKSDRVGLVLAYWGVALNLGRPLVSQTDHDYEGFLDLVSERLVGGDLLMDITYEVVGWNPETKAVKYQVTGDPSSTYEVNVSTVECQICHREAPASSAHLHGDGQVCVLCWDDRLKSSE